MMMQLYKKNGTPRILTYIKDRQIVPNINSVDNLKEYIDQKDLLNSFVNEHFHDYESNSNYAYMEFGGEVSFEHKFRTHIIATIKSIIGEQKEGNPYLGLNAFDYDQSAIFFGRSRLVYDTASKLVSINEVAVRKSLIVLGESGTGKSSFIKAGLIPFLCNNHESDYKYITITPSMFLGKMYNGLLEKLVFEYTFLQNNPFITELLSGIKPDSNFEHLRYALDQNPHKYLIVYIDQFEELLDESLYTNEEREKIIRLLLGIVSTERIHIFISMRNDFYHWFSKNETLRSLKSKCETIDIPMLGISEITQIVEEPAKKAALTWEVNENGESLNKQVITDALHIKELPLIEFALSELYNRRDSNDCLNFKAYNEIGKLNGAIINYANNFYKNLSDDEKMAFSDILGYVIAESSSNKGSYIRKTSLRVNAEKDAITAGLIDKLISSHLFISGKDSNGNPTITIVHEILINSWDFISEWINKEKYFLSRNSYYETICRYEDGTKTSKEKLISGRTPILEAEYHLFRNGDRLQPEVRNLLKLSIRKEVRSGLAWRYATLATLIVSLLGTIIGLILYHTNPIFEYAYAYKDLNILGEISIFIIITIPIVSSIIVRIKGKPRYLTLRHSLIVRIIVIVLLLIATIFIFFHNYNYEEFITNIFYLIVEIIVFASILRELLRRKKWLVSYVPYRLSDNTIREIKIFSMVIAPLLLAFWVLVVTSINESQALNIADGLFDIIDEQKDILTDENAILLDVYKRGYLENIYTGPFAEMGLSQAIEYAQSLINLGEPQKAFGELYPDEDRRHRLLWIICSSYAGIRNNVDCHLELYLNENTYDESGSYTTADLIWPAEELGRFDLAEKVFDIVKDTLPDIQNTYPYIIQRGHISLYKNDLENALKIYKEAIEHSYDHDCTPDMIKHSIQNDFYIFSRESIIPDDILADACEKIGVKFQQTFIPKEAQLLNDMYWEDLRGIWAYENPNKYLTITFEKDVPYVMYKLYNDKDLLTSCFTSNVKIAKGVNGDIFIEELNLHDKSHSLSRLLSHEENSINPELQGQVWKYNKVYESFSSSRILLLGEALQSGRH